MKELLYTVPEVAKLLKMNPTSIHNLRKAGLIRFMKLGSYKVRAEELDRFLKACEGKDLSNPYDIVNLPQAGGNESEENR